MIVIGNAGKCSSGHESIVSATCWLISEVEVYNVMGIVAVIISMIVAVAIAATISVTVGVLIALACAVYQWILSYGRLSTKTKTAQQALMQDVIRNGVFLIPLGGALLVGSWLAALATVVVFGVNLMMS